MSKLVSNTSIRDLIMKYGSDIINSPGMRLEKRFIQHGNVTCYDHSLSVTYMSIWIATKLKIKVDMRSLIRGALLHDYFLYDWHIPDKSHRLHGFHHANTALKNAKRDFTINEIEENIILTHMFPLNLRIPKYRESVIVNLADKICALCEVFNFNFYKHMTSLELK